MASLGTTPGALPPTVPRTAPKEKPVPKYKGPPVGKEERVLEGHGDEVSGVAFSPDGRWLASGGRGSKLMIWDTATWEGLVLGRQSSIRGVAFSPDGRRVATAGWNGDVKIWDTTGQKMVSTFANQNKESKRNQKDGKDSVYCVAFSPDGNRIAFGGGKKQFIISEGRGERAFGKKNETIKLWDLAVRKELTPLHGHMGFIRGVAFSPDDRWIASGGTDLLVKIWDSATGREKLSLKEHTEAVTCVAFSPDGLRIASASADGTAIIWETATGQQLHTLSGHDGTVSSVAFSPDGLQIATGSFDKTAKIWDTTTGRELLTLSGHDDAVNSVSFSPTPAESDLLATASRDTTIRIWAVSIEDGRKPQDAE